MLRRSKYHRLHELEGAAEEKIFETEEKTLRWLSPQSNHSKIQRETRDYRLEGTGEWLLQHSEYLNWCRSGGLIWIHGVGTCNPEDIRILTLTPISGMWKDCIEVMSLSTRASSNQSLTASQFKNHRRSGHPLQIADKQSSCLLVLPIQQCRRNAGYTYHASVDSQTTTLLAAARQSQKSVRRFHQRSHRT